MKLLSIFILIVLIASCAPKTIKIKTSGAEKAGVKNAYIRTTDVYVEEEKRQTNHEPKIDIISPKDGEIIKGRNILININVSNFKLVTPDRYPKEGQGHIQVWVDGMEARSSNLEFAFQNESNGMHIIKAELMLSNNTVLPYSKTIKVFVP